MQKLIEFSSMNQSALMSTPNDCIEFVKKSTIPIISYHYAQSRLILLGLQNIVMDGIERLRNFASKIVVLPSVLSSRLTHPTSPSPKRSNSRFMVSRYQSSPSLGWHQEVDFKHFPQHATAHETSHLKKLSLWILWIYARLCQTVAHAVLTHNSSISSYSHDADIACSTPSYASLDWDEATKPRNVGWSLTDSLTMQTYEELQAEAALLSLFSEFILT